MAAELNTIACPLSDYDIFGVFGNVLVLAASILTEKNKVVHGIVNQKY